MRRNEVRKENEAVARCTRFLVDEQVASSTQRELSRVPSPPTNLIPCPATRYTRWSASVNCRCWNFPEIPPSSWFRNGFVVEWTKKLRKKNGVRFLESERRRQSFECDEIFDFCAREGNIAEFKWECRWKCGVAYLKADVFSLETISKLIQSF